MVGVVDRADLGERVAHERRADEPGLDAVVTLSHQLDKALAGVLALRASAAGRRQSARAVTVSLTTRPEGRRTAVEGGRCLLGDRGVASAALVSRREAVRAHELALCVWYALLTRYSSVFESPGRSGRCCRVEPVAELEALGPETVRGRERGDLVDPGLHALVLGLEDAGVAEALVDRPRHDDGGVAPRGRAGRPGTRTRSTERSWERSGRLLLGGEIAQPDAEHARAR